MKYGVSLAGGTLLKQVRIGGIYTEAIYFLHSGRKYF